MNKAFNENKFPHTLKLSDIVSAFKKHDPTIRQILDHSVFYLYCLKYLKKLRMINLMNMWRHF